MTKNRKIVISLRVCIDRLESGILYFENLCKLACSAVLQKTPDNAARIEEIPECLWRMIPSRQAREDDNNGQKNFI
jgi:hypothetical protein